MVADHVRPVFLMPSTPTVVADTSNTFFGISYYSEGNRTESPGNLILWCGKSAVSRAKENPSQLFAESRVPTFERNMAVTSGLTWKGAGVVFDTSGKPLKADFNPGTQSFERRGVGVHLHRSRFRPVSITIAGTLDPAWAREELARLKAR
jgi:hypothetical protein